MDADIEVGSCAGKRYGSFATRVDVAVETESVRTLHRFIQPWYACNQPVS